MDPLTHVDYAHYILNAFDRTDDDFATGLTLEAREAIADSLEKEITRSMTNDTITEAGFQRACELKAQYLARWAMTRDETGHIAWLDTRTEAAAIVLPYRTILIAASTARS